MNKKTVIQILLIFLIFLITLSFYLKYFDDSPKLAKDKLVEKKVNNNPNTNGGYSFTSFKWFKNGVLVSEKQLFSEGNSADNLLDPNATYQAIMVTEDGDELRTCVFDVILEARKGLSLLQNPVVKGTALKVRADFSKEELKEAVFYLYDSNGRLLKTIKATGVENTIQLPSSIARGVYNLVLMNSKGKSFQRFLVK